MSCSPVFACSLFQQMPMCQLAQRQPWPQLEKKAGWQKLEQQQAPSLASSSPHVKMKVGQ
jgi:hypothetical protein